MDVNKQEDTPTIKSEMESYETILGYDSCLQDPLTDFIKCEVLDDESEEIKSNVQIDPMFVNCKIEAESNDQNLDLIVCQKSEIVITMGKNEKHVESVQEAIKFECQLCDYKAKHKNTLVQHTNSIHEGIRYECKVCEYKANSKSNLSQHVKSIHERLNNHNCKQCDYKTNFNHSLSLHVKSIHEGIKFECKLCDYKAKSKSNLSQHVQSIHKGIKFNCKQCDYKAKSNSNLTQHVKSVHVGVKYSCELCHYKASAPSTLNRHIKSNHKEVTQVIKDEQTLEKYPMTVNNAKCVTSRREKKINLNWTHYNTM